MQDGDEEINRLRLAVAATGAGVWDYNIDTNALQCDDRWHAILGLDPSNPVRTLEDFKPYIHPDDLEQATEVHLTFAELMACGDNYHILYRIVRPDGEVRWVKSAACLIEAGPGRANRAVGAIIDVTGEVGARAALAESEQQFKTLADTVPQIIFSTRADGTVDYLNRRWKEFTGIANPLGERPWLRFVHADDCERLMSVWSEALEEGKSFKAEFRYRHHSGHYRWMASEAIPLRDDEGNVLRWFGANTDIHAAKQLEAERELVARELDHRLKNIYAIIESLINLAARDDPGMEPYAEHLRHRISALVTAHDLIWQSENSGLRLQTLLQTILKPYESDGLPRIVIRGANPEIGKGTTTPLALLFHELATNAAKYGALRSSTGTVRVDIEHGVDDIRVVWIEDVAAPLPQPVAPSPGGFGSKLFTLIVERQLGGRFTHRREAAGVRVNLSFSPAAFAL